MWSDRRHACHNLFPPGRQDSGQAHMCGSFLSWIHFFPAPRSSGFWQFYCIRLLGIFRCATSAAASEQGPLPLPRGGRDMEEDRSTGHALQEKGELSRGHHERHRTERQGLGYHRLRCCATGLGNYSRGRGNHVGTLRKGVTRLSMHFRDTTLSEIHSFVP